MFKDNNKGCTVDAWCKQFWHVYTNTLIRSLSIRFTFCGNEVANLWQTRKSALASGRPPTRAPPMDPAGGLPPPDTLQYSSTPPKLQTKLRLWVNLPFVWRNVVNGLDNFEVGLSHIFPTEGQPFGAHSYTLCGQYNGLVSPGITITVRCAPQYQQHRYVVIRSSDSKAEHLCLAEVAVYDESQYAVSRSLLLRIM